MRSYLPTWSILFHYFKGEFAQSKAQSAKLYSLHEMQGCLSRKQVLSIVGKESGDIVSGECTNCGRCIEVCEDDSLSFGIRSYIKKWIGDR